VTTTYSLSHITGPSQCKGFWDFYHNRTNSILQQMKRKFLGMGLGLDFVSARQTEPKYEAASVGPNRVDIGSKPKTFFFSPPRRQDESRWFGEEYTRYGCRCILRHMIVDSSTSAARLSLNRSKAGLAWLSLRRQLYA
jgi:hypothetical protein